MSTYRNPFLSGLGITATPHYGFLVNGQGPASPASSTPGAQPILQPNAQSHPLVLNSAQTAAYPAAGATTVLINYVVPAGSTLVINALALVNIGGSNVDNSGVIFWHVLRNGAGVRGLENLSATMGTLAQPQAVDLVLQENEILTITVSVPVGQVAPLANSPAARALGFLKLAVKKQNLFAAI